MLGERGEEEKEKDSVEQRKGKEMRDCDSAVGGEREREKREGKEKEINQKEKKWKEEEKDGENNKKRREERREGGKTVSVPWLQA